MNIAKLIGSLTVIFLSLLALDSIYFFFVQASMINMISSIQKTPMKVNMFYFVLCYLFLTFAIYYFIIKERKPTIDAFLLGLTVYAIYELTNASIFTKWKNWVILVDSIWGGVLFSLVTIIYRYFYGN